MEDRNVEDDRVRRRAQTGVSAGAVTGIAIGIALGSLGAGLGIFIGALCGAIAGAVIGGALARRVNPEEMDPPANDRSYVGARAPDVDDEWEAPAPGRP